jgi:hypothetical protein
MQREFDRYFPTVVRYLGVGLILVFVGGALSGRDLPESILVAATGMILFKAVKGGGEGNGNPT